MTILGVAMLISPVPSRADASAALDMRTFMVMNVCTSPDGQIDPTHVPTDADCAGMRPIEPGEVPPYYMSNFATPATVCANGGGPIAKINVPVAIGATIRIVSLDSHKASDTGCTGPGVSSAVGASIQWHDEDYSFIMGSWSPVSLSTFVSPLCATSGSGSGRFYRGWVLAPNQVSGPDWSVFFSRLLTGSAQAEEQAACPTRFAGGFTAWQSGEFLFESGLTLDAIISDHYAAASIDPAGPGTSKQFERTYWTQQFGLSRWEKWAREDWIDPANGLDPATLSAKLLKAGTCSIPYIQAGIMAGLVTQPAEDASYAMDVVDPLTNTQHRWYMTLCEDYTNIVRSNATSLMTDIGMTADPAFWQ